MFPGFCHDDTEMAILVLLFRNFLKSLFDFPCFVFWAVSTQGPSVNGQEQQD